jgi:hypothetical protein
LCCPSLTARCGGHLDTISADLEARPPLTRHHGCGTRRMSNPDPRDSRRTVTISLCRFDGGEEIDLLISSARTFSAGLVAE